MKIKKDLLKYGIIGAIIGIIGKVLSLIMNNFILSSIFSPFEIVIAIRCVLSGGNFCNNLMLLRLFGLFFTIIIWFVVGVLIGWIYRKIKPRGEEYRK